MRFGNIFYQKISPGLAFSMLLFVVFYISDLYVTNISANGNIIFEANAIARLWWEITGPFRFIEVPIWIAIVITVVCIINIKSEFLALLWLNFLAFQHLLGAVTWLPYGTMNFLYALPEWAVGYGISLISITLAIPVTFVLIKTTRLTTK